jgi:hypothetical protein
MWCIIFKTMIKQLLILLFVASTFVACNQQAANSNTESTENKEKTENEEKPKTAENEPAKKGKIIKAKFIAFQLGDASHYMFEDEQGNELDFSQNEDKTHEFARELPEAESNEDNQGWGSQKELQGKWFEIRYEVQQMPMYQDGPVGDVEVILEAKLLD